MSIGTIIIDLLYIFLIVSIPVLTKYIVLLLKTKKIKTDNEVLDAYLENIQDIISEAVISVNQTYVDSLKETNSFGKEEQGKAYTLAKDTILRLIDQEILDILDENYMDVSAYIDTLIESAVCKNKRRD